MLFTFLSLELSIRSDPYCLTIAGKDRIEAKLQKLGCQWWNWALKASKSPLCLRWPLFFLALRHHYQALALSLSSSQPYFPFLSALFCLLTDMVCSTVLWNVASRLIFVAWLLKEKVLLSSTINTCMDFREGLVSAWVICPSLEQLLWLGTCICWMNSSWGISLCVFHFLPMLIVSLYSLFFIYMPQKWYNTRQALNPKDGMERLDSSTKTVQVVGLPPYLSCILPDCWPPLGFWLKQIEGSERQS